MEKQMNEYIESYIPDQQIELLKQNLLENLKLSNIQNKDIILAFIDEIVQHLNKKNSMFVIQLKSQISELQQVIQSNQNDITNKCQSVTSSLKQYMRGIQHNEQLDNNLFKNKSKSIPEQKSDKFSSVLQLQQLNLQILNQDELNDDDQ